MSSNLVFKNTVLFSVLLMCYCNSLKAQSKKERKDVAPISRMKLIKTGADNYTEYLPLLAGKKIGIVTNPTGILGNKTHLVDFLLDQKVALEKIFAPEH